MIRRSAAALALGVLAASAGASGSALAAQDLGARVGRADGSVAFHFAARPDVEVCEGFSIRLDEGRITQGRWREGWDQGCVRGAAEVRLTLRDGRVRAVEVGPPGTARADRDLGAVSAADAARWLLSLGNDAEPKAARDAVVPAVLADSVETWPRLLEIARDAAADRELRQSALFWVSRAAADVVTGGLRAVAADAVDDEEVRKSAVFALSRRPADQAVPLLMDLGRTAPGRGVREAALFWLARIDDPRVVPFFEAILQGSGRD